MGPLDQIPAYILCGGKSSRMTTEKGLVKLQENTFIDRIISVLESNNMLVKLITENENYSEIGYEILPDIYKNKGPLAGIHSALADSKKESILVLSCDIPLFNSQTLTALHSNAVPEKEVVYATANGKDHPLVGFYKKSLLKKLENALDNNDLKVMNFVKEQNFQKIEIDDARSLSNINTPLELQELENNIEL